MLFERYFRRLLKLSQTIEEFLRQEIPSARKWLQMKIWRFDFAVAFVMERQMNSPRFSFAFTFVMVMLGTHKPQQQATLTNKNKIPEIFFRFRNSTERKSQILRFLFIFACKYFCEDGSLKSSNDSFRMRLFYLHLRSFYLRFVFFTYGGGTVSKKDQTQFPDGENLKQNRPNRISGPGGTISTKEQTDFPP